MKQLTSVAAVATFLMSVPAHAQDMDHQHMGMDMPAPDKPKDGHQGHPAPSPSPSPSRAPSDKAPPAPGGTHAHHPGMKMDGMAMPDMPGISATGGMQAMSMNPEGYAAGSGTSRQPSDAGAMRGVHVATGDWMVMAHGYVWGVWTDQGGRRGGDMAFAASMAMITATRQFAGGTRLQLRSMLSAEPVMGPRGYPNLLATGETAHGLPLVDRQHPHDLFMELAARVDVPLGDGLTGFVYGGPVGEPALGPTAFMHRASATYLALAPIGHHWFDSTHITYGVVTAGIGTGRFQIEGSGFRGREPDEHRWDIEAPAIDSWSLRASWTPDAHWAAQISYGRIHAPEVMHGGEDEGRFTASVQYAGGTGINATLAYAIKDRIPGPALSAWLAEVNWDVTRHHSIFGRIENVANDELFPDHADPLHDRKFRVTRFEGGYAYRLPVAHLFDLAIGGSLAAYALPAALEPAYGKAPVSATLFAKLVLGR